MKLEPGDILKIIWINIEFTIKIIKIRAGDDFVEYKVIKSSEKTEKYQGKKKLTTKDGLKEMRNEYLEKQKEPEEDIEYPEVTEYQQERLFEG